MSRIVETLKSQGEYVAAGMAAFKDGQSAEYGCHYGMRSTRDAAIAQYRQGWNAARIIDQARPYYILAELPKGETMWEQRFGDFDKRTVEQERRDVMDSGEWMRGTKLRILKCCNSQVSIENAMLALNLEGGDWAKTATRVA